MLKFSTLIALFICFVYSNNEHNVEMEVPENELEVPMKRDIENTNTVQTIKGHYVEEKKSTKPCKENKNRRFDDEDSQNLDLLESLPLSASTEQMNTATMGNKIVTTTLQGASYNYKNENNNRKTHEGDSKDCGCGDCVIEANKKVLQFESLAINGNSGPFDIGQSDIENSEAESTNSNSNTLNTEAFDESRSDDRNTNPLDSIPLNSNTGENIRPCNKGLKLNTRRRKCGKTDLSEDTLSSPTTRRILPGIIENPTNQELGDNKLYQDSPQPNFNKETEADNRQTYFPNTQKVSNSYDIDLVHNMNINEAPLQSTPLEDSVEGQLIEPTRGKGIYDMKDAGVMLLENSRVCYACSTVTDPTCWSPDRRTTVKYCRKGHKSCLTKSFKHNGKTVIIRDCGSYCVNMPGSKNNYRSCSICHSDLCNGATSMYIYTTGVTVIAFLGVLFNTR